MPDYRIRTLALPHGVYPRDVGWALRGEAKGVAYRHDAILMVAGGAAPSPFARTFEPTRLPRIQAIDQDFGHWLAYFEKNPTNASSATAIPPRSTVPAGRRDRLKSLPNGLSVIEREASRRLLVNEIRRAPIQEAAAVEVGPGQQTGQGLAR